VDILVRDIGMADVDDYDLIRRIREEESATSPRTAGDCITDYARVYDRQRALLARYQMHLASPLSHENSLPASRAF
jgi:CheY-like chemotaxis protein